MSLCCRSDRLVSDMYDMTEIHSLKEERENSEEKVDEEDNELFVCAGKIRGTQNKCCRHRIYLLMQAGV